MRVRLVIAALIVACGGVSAAPAVPPIRNPALLNIGFVCHWQKRCMERQQRAMKRALAYVKKHRPPLWKVQECNRNASRRRNRVDWIGYNNCIRNPTLRYYGPPKRQQRRRR